MSVKQKYIIKFINVIIFRYVCLKFDFFNTRDNL